MNIRIFYAALHPDPDKRVTAGTIGAIFARFGARRSDYPGTTALAGLHGHPYNPILTAFFPAAFLFQIAIFSIK
ncbi:hypothetical protein ACL2XP_02280 [Sodalis sp. RH21]|uniref:hypothetical protein n=1 Tax=unclassified Sodalis (in: enterobacteria) TaxID=2636512 RepID=UPI0039B4A5A5